MTKLVQDRIAPRLFTSRGEPAEVHPVLNVLVGLLLTVVLIPFVYLLIRAFEKPLPEIVDLLFRGKTLEVLGTTALLLVIVVAVNIFLGTLISVGLHFVRVPKAHLLIVASVLMAMGMAMLSPMMISMPFKLMLFVLVDGWSLIMGSLAASFVT